MRSLPLFAFPLFLGLAACSEESETPASAGAGGTSGNVDDGCPRGTLESDITYLPRTGPRVDANGVLMPPPAASYVVSSTFLRLRSKDDANRRFGELMAPISALLEQQPGLEALQLAVSGECKTARTLSVWASLDVMYDFVASDAHQTAVRAVSEVSRGGSVVVHWSAENTEQASWDEAARRLTAAPGPFY